MDSLARAMIVCVAMVLTSLLTVSISTRPAPPAPAEGSRSMAAGPPVDAGFADPGLSGLCNEADLDYGTDVPGASSPEAAIDALVAGGELPDAVTVESHRILFEGDLVGVISTAEAPAGGHLVVAYEWCHP
ncbi:MAG: hypothetical protein KG028_12900 [Actinobacteria bacterium]|jgi:hypothetical protein|nr:hypothetical protein [Actinomycetota bacterium]